MRLLAWTVAHVVAVGVLAGLSSILEPFQQGLALLAIPVVLGAAQWAFLARALRWWGLLWLPACVLGIYLVFLAGGYWFVYLTGAGVGLMQGPLLSAAGFRRVWLWPLASGLGWITGVVGVGVLLGPLGLSFSPGGVDALLFFSAVTLFYGISTGLTVRAMRRPGRLEDPAAVSVRTGSLAGSDVGA